MKQQGTQRWSCCFVGVLEQFRNFDSGSAASDRFQPARGRPQHGVATRGATLWGIDGRGAASPPTTLVPRAPEGGEDACFVFQVQVWYNIAQKSSKMVRNGRKPVKIVQNITKIVEKSV